MRLSSRRMFSHVPVMAQEVLNVLKPDNGKVYIDMTFGGGGHSRRLLDTNKSIKIIAVDRDPVAYRAAQELSREIAIKSERLNIKQTVIPVHGQFSRVLREIHLSGVPYGSVNGVLFDLGASSMQYDDARRGFSVNSDGPLDMRMDTTNDSAIKAEDVVNNLSVESLDKIIKTYGEERRSRKISNAIVDGRTMLGRIRTTQELARIASTSAPATVDALGRYAHGGTRLFQALRIFVNNELNELNYALEKIRDFLIPTRLVRDRGEGPREEDLIEGPYGVAVVLTFHSLEDRIVKRHFTGIDKDEPDFRHMSQHDRIQTTLITDLEAVQELGHCTNWKPISRHVHKPTETEMAANPRSRSAKLRAALRIL